MNKKKVPLPWYAGPFILLLGGGGAIGILMLMRDSEPGTVMILILGCMVIALFGVRGIYAAWKNTDNKFLISLAKITKVIMITLLFVAVAVFAWIALANPDDVGRFLGPVFRKIVTALLPSK